MGVKKKMAEQELNDDEAKKEFFEDFGKKIEEPRTKEIITGVLILMLLIAFFGACYYGYTVEQKFNECAVDRYECSQKCNLIPLAQLEGELNYEINGTT